MNKFAVVLLLMPFLSAGQDKNILHVTRVFPRIDKIADFEKALTAHAQKYHTGDWKWRVMEIQTGPDAGGYNIVEGPHNWDQIDKRGDLGAEHQQDWNKTIATHLSDRYQAFFIEFKSEFSAADMTKYSDKLAINHVYYKPGTYEQVTDVLKKLQKVWSESKMSIAVYEASSSGAPQIMVVTRYMTGLKERQAGFMKPMKERYEAVHGANSFGEYLATVEKITNNSWSELLFTRLDLSSK